MFLSDGSSGRLMLWIYGGQWVNFFLQDYYFRTNTFSDFSLHLLCLDSDALSPSKSPVNVDFWVCWWLWSVPGLKISFGWRFVLSNLNALENFQQCVIYFFFNKLSTQQRTLLKTKCQSRSISKAIHLRKCCFSMKIITHLFSYPLFLTFLHLTSHKGLNVGFLIYLLTVLLHFH